MSLKSLVCLWFVFPAPFESSLRILICVHFISLGVQFLCQMFQFFQAPLLLLAARYNAQNFSNSVLLVTASWFCLCYSFGNLFLLHVSKKELTNCLLWTTVISMSLSMDYRSYAILLKQFVLEIRGTLICLCTAHVWIHFHSFCRLLWDVLFPLLMWHASLQAITARPCFLFLLSTGSSAVAISKALCIVYDDDMGLFWTTLFPVPWVFPSLKTANQSLLNSMYQQRNF